MTCILTDPGSLERPLKCGQDESDDFISIRLSQASLSDFFRLLAQLSSLNIVVDPDVKGTLTLDVTWMGPTRILETVLESHQLVKTEGGELIRIMTHQTAQKEAEEYRAETETRKQARTVRTLFRQLNYPNAKTLSAQIQKRGFFLSEQEP